MIHKRANLRMVNEDDPRFNAFWDAYPKRVAKKDARHAWWKLNPTSELIEQIMAALIWQVPLQRWDSDKYEFAPYPASWLNARRWEDEPPKPSNGNERPSRLPAWAQKKPR